MIATTGTYWQNAIHVDECNGNRLHYIVPPGCNWGQIIDPGGETGAKISIWQPEKFNSIFCQEKCSLNNARSPPR